MSFFEYMMRHAAPVLFWTAVLLLIGAAATSLLLDQSASPYSGDGGITARSVVIAVHQALASAVLPFLGAAIIWTLQRRPEDRD